MSDIEWKIDALRLALKKAPDTIWTPGIVVDYPGQRICLETMREEFGDLARSALSEIGRAPETWALTNKWPRLRKQAVYFLRESLSEAFWRAGGLESPVRRKHFICGAPPWSAEQAQWFNAVTVEAWRSDRLEEWIESETQREFDVQEMMNFPDFDR